MCGQIVNVWSNLTIDVLKPSQHIDNQLRTAAEAFLENDSGCVVDSGKGEVRLSQIFKWYKADFGGTDEKVVLETHTINKIHVQLFFIYGFVFLIAAEMGAGSYGRFSKEELPAGRSFCWED